MLHRLFPFALALCLVFSYQPALTQQDEKIARLLKDHFTSIEQDDTTTFSKALSKQLEGKTIVAFGEATHGTRQFRQGFSSLAKDLILHQGFTTVLLAEFGFSDLRELNNYVLGIQDCPGRYSKNLVFLDEELKKLIEWLRIYNATKSFSKRVWLVGGDVSNVTSVAKDAIMISEELKIGLPQKAFLTLSELSFLPNELWFDYFRENEPKSLLSNIDSLFVLVKEQSRNKKLDFRQEQLVQSISNLPAAIRNAKSWYGKKFLDQHFRDSAMFSNLQWIRRVRPDSKIVLLAHNAHVERRVGYVMGREVVRLGHILNNSYDSEYFVIGTESGKGNFGQGYISSKADRIGDILLSACSTNGLIKFKEDPQLTSFFEQELSMLFANLQGEWIFPIKRAADAFDVFYFVPESIPTRAEKGDLPISAFSLNTAIGLSNARKFTSEKKIRLELLSSFSQSDGRCQREEAYVAILFIDKENKAADFKAMLLSPGKIQQGYFDVPKNAVAALITVVGKGMEEITLSKYEIDGVAVQSGEAKLYGTGFKKVVYQNIVTIRKEN